MISQLVEHRTQFDFPVEKCPAHVVFTDTLRELYWSKSQLMRTLLKLESTALNVILQRTIHDYFEVTRSHSYSIEHIFELLDESTGGRKCSLTETSSANALAMLSSRTDGKDRLIRSSVVEFYAQEITSLEYLFKLALSMGRLDIARIVGDMQRKTRSAFESAFPVSPSNTAAA